MLKKLGCAALLGAMVASAAHAGTIVVSNGAASVSISATSAMGTAAPFGVADLGNANVNGLVSSASTPFAGGVISFTNTTSPLSGVYDGSVVNVAFNAYSGTTLPNANYLAAEPGGSAIISYTVPQSVVNLLWGSIDSYDSLNLEFLNGGTLVGSVSVTGTQIAAAAGVTNTGGSSAYVTLTPGGSLTSFNTVVATATQAAFEFNIGTAVPEPATFALLATGLVGVALRRFRRSR